MPSRPRNRRVHVESARRHEAANPGYRVEQTYDQVTAAFEGATALDNDLLRDHEAPRWRHIG
jgi:hypothetical protein